MGNEKWKMENGKWKMENGKWKMGNGKSLSAPADCSCRLLLPTAPADCLLPTAFCLLPFQGG
jgi:hypothetical protein